MERTNDGRHRVEIAALLCAGVLAGGGCATMPRVDQDLFAAAKTNNATEAKRLLAAGANVNGRNEQYFEGLTPLAWAAGSGSIETAEVLLAHGADVNGPNAHGSTPLHIAAYHEEPETVALLIRHGAEVNTRNEAGWTPLYKAMERLGFLPATQTPSDGEVAKVAAIMKLLLASGARVDVRDSHGGLPIHLAALTKQTALVQILIDKGTDIDDRGIDGMTPLYQAARVDAVDVAKLLLARGADVNARARHGNTPLSIAAIEGNPAVASVLLSHGAAVDPANDEGMTPLAWACKGLLVRYSVQATTPAARDLRSRVPAREIEQDRERFRNLKGQFVDVARLLVEHGANPNVLAGDSTPLRAAALAGEAALVDALLAHGAPIDEAPTGETALHAAIGESHGDVAALLVKKGANVNARNFNQRTPLHFLAIFMHDPKTAELLIQHGADVNAKDKDGRTPLAYATQVKNTEIADVLRLHGAI